MPDASGPLAKKLTTFIQFNKRELASLVELQATTICVGRGQALVNQGERSNVGYILKSGWGRSFKVLNTGERQIITFPIPGDFVGFRSAMLRASDHSFQALTNIVVSRVAIPRMMHLFAEFPHVGSAILWATSRDEAITVEHLASVGRRSAIERTAHFFLELGARLQLVGLSKGIQFSCPLSQYDLSDALGLSAIHVNRVLRDLREAKLLTFHNHKVTIHDRTKLKALAGFEDIEEAAVVTPSETECSRPQSLG